MSNDEESDDDDVAIFPGSACQTEGVKPESEPAPSETKSEEVKPNVDEPKQDRNISSNTMEGVKKEPLNSETINSKSDEDNISESTGSFAGIATENELYKSAQSINIAANSTEAVNSSSNCVPKSTDSVNSAALLNDIVNCAATSIDEEKRPGKSADFAAKSTKEEKRHPSRNFTPNIRGTNTIKLNGHFEVTVKPEYSSIKMPRKGDILNGIAEGLANGFKKEGNNIANGIGDVATK